MVIKLSETVAKVCLGVVCIAAVSASTLMLKTKYDRYIDSVAQAQLSGRDTGFELTEPEVDASDDLPGRQRTTSTENDDKFLNSIIDEEFGELSDEEREIWAEGLRGRSPLEIRDILAMRRRFEPAELKISDDYQFLSADANPPRPLPEDSMAKASPMPSESQSLLAYSLEALQTAEQIVLNNIANANTIGFKRMRVLLSDGPYRHVKTAREVDDSQRGPAPSPSCPIPAQDSSIRLGSGTAIGVTRLDCTQGTLRHTKQPLDLAIEGDGYFQVRDGERIVYTRMGAFATDGNGRLALISGEQTRILQPEIRIPINCRGVTIGNDGIVSDNDPGHSIVIPLGQIQLAKFPNPQGLQAIGDGLWESTARAGEPIVSRPGDPGLGELRQDYLENSNVSLEDELAELHRLREQIKALRTFHEEPSAGGSGKRD